MRLHAAMLLALHKPEGATGTARVTHFPRPLQGLTIMSRRLCVSFFLGAAASRSSRTAWAAASSLVHTILALFSRRLQTSDVFVAWTADHNSTQHLCVR